MSTHHTPTPWKVLPGSTQVIRDQGALIGETVCEAEDSGSFVQDEAKNAANAAFIARACNSHDQLLAALRRLRGWLADDPDTLESLYDEVHSTEFAGTAHSRAVEILLEQASAALAQAEAQS